MIIDFEVIKNKIIAKNKIINKCDNIKVMWNNKLHYANSKLN